MSPTCSPAAELGNGWPSGPPGAGVRESAPCRRRPPPAAARRRRRPATWDRRGRADPRRRAAPRPTAAPSRCRRAPRAGAAGLAGSSARPKTVPAPSSRSARPGSSTSQTRIVPSWLPEASTRPSPLKTRVETAPRCAGISGAGDLGRRRRLGGARRGCQRPEPHRFVLAAGRGQQLAVGAERQRGDRAALPPDGLVERVARGQPPDAERAVQAAGRGQAAIGARGEAQHGAGDSPRSRPVAAVEAPDPHPPIVRAGRDQLAVRGDRQPGDGPFVATDLAERRAVLGAPQPDAAVVAARDQALAARAEGERADPVLVVLQAEPDRPAARSATSHR